MQIQFLEVIFFWSSGGALMLDIHRYRCIYIVAFDIDVHATIEITYRLCNSKTNGIQYKNMDMFIVKIHNV